MEPIDTYERSGLTVELLYDGDYTWNPLTDYDSPGKRIGWGDHTYQGHVPDGFEKVAEPDLEYDASDDWDREDWRTRTLTAALIADHGPAFVVLLDWASNNHGPGTASLDVTDDDERANLAWMFTTEEIAGEWLGSTSKAVAYVKAAAKEFEQWCNGQVYGYIVKDGERELDSCWGFICDAWDDDAYIRQVANESADWQRERIDAEKVEAHRCACADIVTVGALGSEGW
jgi:hypothetical protein